MKILLLQLLTIAYKRYKVSGIDSNSIEELFEIRELIETYVARSLADRAKCGDKILHNETSLLVKEMDEGEHLFDKGDEENAFRISIAFHKKLISLLNNRFITKMILQLSDHLFRAQNLSSQVPPRIKRSFQEHKRILNGILGGKGSEVEKYTIVNVLNKVT